MKDSTAGRRAPVYLAATSSRCRGLPPPPDVHLGVLKRSHQQVQVRARRRAEKRLLPANFVVDHGAECPIISVTFLRCSGVVRSHARSMASGWLPVSGNRGRRTGCAGPRVPSLPIAAALAPNEESRDKSDRVAKKPSDQRMLLSMVRGAEGPPISVWTQPGELSRRVCESWRYAALGGTW